MPRRAGPMYGGDYDEVTAAKLADVDLPERLHCKTCRQDKPISQYSKRQKSNLRYNVLRFYKRNTQGAGDYSIVCRSCTPQVNNELLCIMCDHVKDLASFAKNHRSKPEQARCKECMYEQQLNDQPGLEEYSDGSDSERSNPNDSDDDTQSETGDTLPLTLDNLHITQGQRVLSSQASEGRRKAQSSRLLLSSNSRSHNADDIFGNDESTEDDMQSNASTIGGVVIGSDSAAIGSNASTTGDGSDDGEGDADDADALSAVGRWENLKTTGYRAGKAKAKPAPPARVDNSKRKAHTEMNKGKAFTAYDAQGTPHRRHRTESVTSQRSSSISHSSRDNFPRGFANAKSTGNRNLKPSREDFPNTMGHHLGMEDDDDDSEGEMFL